MAEWYARVGVEKFVASMRRRAWFFGKQRLTEVHVGFSADYALRVHEDLEMPHKVGQAKFLETAIREMWDHVVPRVKYLLGNGYAMDAAMQAEGSRILARAQELVPVDTGFLRDSG
jgi:hypothetical protein